MAAYEVELTLTSAKDLKNVNWRNGHTRPYAVVWVEPQKKCSTKVDEEGDTSPFWGETLVVPIPPGQPIEDTTLYIDVVHAGSDEGTKPLIGSARLKLVEVLDDGGLGGRVSRTLKLKRPSGRPQGKLEVEVCVREPLYRSRDAYYAPPHGVPRAAPAYGVPPPYGASQAAPAYGAPPPPYGYQYGAAPPPPQASYGYQSYGYGAPPASYEQQPVYSQEEKKSKFGGMGTGLAVGAVAGVLGGLALAEGVDAVEDHIADDVEDKVEDDLGYDGDDF